MDWHSQVNQAALAKFPALDGETWGEWLQRKNADAIKRIKAGVVSKQFVKEQREYAYTKDEK